MPPEGAKRAVLGPAEGTPGVSDEEISEKSVSHLNRENGFLAKKETETSQKELRNFKAVVDIWRRTKQRDQGKQITNRLWPQ